MKEFFQTPEGKAGFHSRRGEESARALRRTASPPSRFGDKKIAHRCARFAAV